MNDTEAANVLGLLNAAWPNSDLPDRTVELWIGLLCEMEMLDAREAAKTVIRQDNWFPSIARFTQTVEAARHARRNREAASRGLPSARWEPSPLPQALIDATRGLIAEQASKKHWHGGPKPCPVCGGIAPSKPERATRPPKDVS